MTSILKYPAAVQQAIRRDENYHGRAQGEYDAYKNRRAERAPIKDESQKRIARMESPEFKDKLYREQRDPTNRELIIREPTGELKAAKVELEKIELEEKQESKNYRESILPNFQATLANLNDNKRYLRQNPPNTIVLHDFPAPKLGRGETPFAAIRRLSAQRAETVAEIRKVETADLSLDAALARGLAQLESLDRSGQPRIKSLFSPSSKAGIIFPNVTIDHPRATFDALPVAVHVLRPLFDQWLKDAIASHVALHGEGMSDQERAAKLEELHGRRVEIDYEIEALVRMIEAEGGTFIRERSWDVRARLGLAPSMPPLRSA